MRPRRSLAAALAAALSVVLVPALTPRTDAATEVRHYLDADQFGTPGSDNVLDIDAAGDLVVSAGTVAGALPGQASGGGVDAFVRATGGDLAEQWTLQLGGTGADSAATVATDGERVVVGGHTEDGFDETDPGGWLVLLDANGDLELTFAVPDNAGVAAVALAGGTVYASGSVAGRATVWRFDDAGEVAWTASLTDFGPDSGTFATGNQILVLDDQVVVTERIYYDDDDGTRTFALDAATGEENWATSVGYGGSTGIATDGENIYVTRWSQNFDTYRYIGLLIALGPDGTALWREELYDRDDIDFDARAVAWDGNAVVAVSRLGLVAFSPAGRRRWDQPLPAGLDAAVATYGATAYGAWGVYVGGSTNRALGGPRLGGRDAVVGRFVLYQPDARVRVGPDVHGDDRYSRRGQRLTVTIARGRSTSVRLTAQNDGEVTQPLRLRGCSGQDGYEVTYQKGSSDVTREMTRRRGLRASGVGPGGVSLVGVTIHAGRGAAERSTCTLVVSSIVSGERDRFTLALRRS